MAELNNKRQIQELFWKKGIEAYKLGRFDEAICLFKMFIKNEPKSVIGLYRLGMAYHGNKEFKEAIKCYDKAISVDAKFADAHCDKGVALAELGNRSSALKSYARAILLDPEYAEAFYNQGISLLALGLTENAINSFRDAIRLNANFIMAELNIGVALTKLGKYMEALRLYDNLIDKAPYFSSAFLNRGIVLNEMSRFDEALKCFDKAISMKSDYPQAFYSRAKSLAELKRFDDALDSYAQAISIQPDYSEAVNNRFRLLIKLNRFDEAFQIYEQGISTETDDAESLYIFGNALLERQYFAEALRCYDKAISIFSEHVDALHNRGIILASLNRFDEALKDLDKVISIKPDYALAFYNHGNTLHEMKRFDKALQSYDKAISIKSDYEKAFYARGNSLHAMQRFYDALRSYDKAICIKADYVEAFLNRGITLAGLNRFDEALASYDAAIKFNPSFFYAHSNRLFTMSYTEGFSHSYKLAEAKNFGTEATRSAEHVFASWNTDKLVSKLRLGFISGDFRTHPVAFFLESFLTKLDKKKFEIVAYTTNVIEDEVTVRLKKFFCIYKSLIGLNDKEAATLIHDDGVQILIDLSGHSSDNRLPVFAYKPAPVQATWLGYCATTGVQQIDYILGDSFVTPPDEQHHFSEKIKIISNSYICYSPPDRKTEIRSLPALNNGYITFGSFNNFAKINENVIRVWSKILLSVGGARLFLKASQLGNVRLVEDTISLFNKFGVANDRLSFEGHIKNWNDHFDAYNKVDIGLDPFPYNGVTTTLEALWMGVPVITKKGNFFLAHNGEAIAHNTGQTEWIAEDDTDYIAKTVKFASDLQSLAQLRSGLRAQILSSPLLDAQSFACNFEKAMLEMWEDYKNRE